MQENYLAKWLNNELTGKALEDFKKSGEYATYMKIKEASSRLEAPDFDTDKTWESIQARKEGKPPKVVAMAPFKAFLRVAAVVAVLLAGAYFYSTALNETVSTTYAQTQEVTLPDASKVFLNADSKISYSKNGWEERRQLSLQGEAFFKVAKGKTFTVATTAGSVTVLGTQFNVVQRKGLFQVSCFEGLVSIQHNGKTTPLPAGNQWVVQNGAIAQYTVPKNGRPAWLNNESSFKSMPLGYVLSELERQHNVTVVPQQVDTLQLYTGSFSNTNLELALKSIAVPLKLNYKLDGNKVMLYGEDTP